MNTLRTTLITALVITASLVALRLPLTIAANAEQTPRSTGATISLVDSLPSEKASTLTTLAQPKPARIKTEPTKPQISPEPEPRMEEPIPASISEEGIAPIETRAIIESELATEPKVDPLSQPDEMALLEKSLSDSEVEPTSSPDDSLKTSSSTEASLASVAASELSFDPKASLVDGYYEATDLDQGPSFNRTALASRIRYPSLAKRQGIEGLVMLRLFISITGKVERIEVEEDPGYGLAQAAVSAFSGLQGEPALLGGKAVPVTLRYPVRFSLK